MKRSNNIVVLQRSGLIAILMAVLCACASQFPLDDAYYRPEKTIPVIQKTPSAPSTPSAPALPAIEYLNVQDTTVTIRIKK